MDNSSGKPWYLSKRWAGLLLGAALLITLQVMGADSSVIEPLAWGVAAALGVFIGGESLVDRARANGRPVEIGRETLAGIVSELEGLSDRRPDLFTKYAPSPGGPAYVPPIQRRDGTSGPA